ncbi:MAG: GxxExxY protein [Flavobacteriales bacterium]
MEELSKSDEQLFSLIIDTCFTVHSELGPGLLESIYEECLSRELTSVGLSFERQKNIPVLYKGESLDMNFRVDILVENKFIIEIKSVSEINGTHYAQLLTYLKLTNLHVGLLVNFNERLLKTGLRRVINSRYSDKTIQQQ